MPPVAEIAATPVALAGEKTVTITEREYNSLRATADLLQHMDILEFTLKNRDSKGKTSLEEAFQK